MPQHYKEIGSEDFFQEGRLGTRGQASSMTPRDYPPTLPTPTPQRISLPCLNPWHREGIDGNAGAWLRGRAKGEDSYKARSCCVDKEGGGETDIVDVTWSGQGFNV